MTDILGTLNEAQKDAVTTTEGFVRVIAGAGTGKTRALSHRFAYLVHGLGILPGNILCVTFTNKSANEMRQRIHRLTGDDDTGYINTFHGFCVSVLQEDANALNYPKSFLVLDNTDIDAMLEMVYEERGLSLREMTYAKARDMIEIRKTFKERDYYRYIVAMSIDGLKQKYLEAEKAEDIIFYGYLYQQKKCFGLDYNDLIIFTLYIFREHEDLRLKWQKRLEYIMIDEFQDIDELQYQLMELLCGYHKNLFVVGDPDQTIYTWRGAKLGYLLGFDKAFPNVHTIMMMQNYRSTPQILNAANSLIGKNVNRIKKDLIPMLPSGEQALCHLAQASVDEAEWIAGKIAELHDNGTPYKDITVLYRANYVSRGVESALLKNKIPYIIYSGTQFYERMEIKDAHAYLRMTAYRDDLSFLRIANVPKRNLGKSRMAFLQQYAVENQCTLYEALKRNLDNDKLKGAKGGQFVELIDKFSAGYENRPVSELLSDILNESGYEKKLRTEGSQERLDNLAELRQSIYEYETTCGEECTLEYYLGHVALFTNSDTAETGDKVKLMTIHAAKGLEFPYVFLCGMSEGIFPSRKVRTRQAMEEERRLAFVAFTRAEKMLYFSESGGRNHDNTPRYPSRFLLDVDPGILAFTHEPDESTMREARDYAERTSQWMPDNDSDSIFPVGQRVEHMIFGPGTVVEVDLENSAHMVLFDEIGTPRKISFRAKLEKLSE